MDTGGLRTAGPVVTDSASVARPNKNISKMRNTTATPEVSYPQNEIFELEAAILTILDLNKVELTQSSAAEFIKLLASTPIETVEKNARLLERYGILPPVEIEGMSGGMLGAPSQTAQSRPLLPSQRLAAQQSIFGRAPLDLASLPPPPAPPAWATTRPSWWNSTLTFGAPPPTSEAALSAEIDRLSQEQARAEEVVTTRRTSGRTPVSSSIMEMVKAEKAERQRATDLKRIAKEEARVKRMEDEKRAAANTGVSVVEIPDTYDELSPILKSLDVCAPRSAGKFMKALFPEKAVSKWVGMGLQCRQIYEQASVPSQCNNVILKVNRETDKCYVCGFGFFEKPEENVYDARLDEYEIEDCDQVEPTCEHILPIIQAIFFLDLYRPTDKGNLTPEQLSVLKKEYAWAHRCCNYTKGDNISFLKTVINRSTRIPTWEFNLDDTYKYLKDISTDSDRKGLNIIRDMIGKTEAKRVNWRDERVNKIRIERVNPILEYIASKGMGGTIIMIGFQNCVDTSKLSDRFNEVLRNVRASESGKAT